MSDKQRIPNPTPRLEKLREGYHPEQPQPQFHSIRLSDEDWTTVLVGLADALGTFDLSGADPNEIAAAQRVADVHNKIAMRLKRNARAGVTTGEDES